MPTTPVRDEAGLAPPRLRRSPGDRAPRDRSAGRGRGRAAVSTARHRRRRCRRTRRPTKRCRSPCARATRATGQRRGEAVIRARELALLSRTRSRCLAGRSSRWAPCGGTAGGSPRRSRARLGVELRDLGGDRAVAGGRQRLLIGVAAALGLLELLRRRREDRRAVLGADVVALAVALCPV